MTRVESTADAAARVVPIDSIVVRDRYRQELGDLTGLRESIARLGVLNPLTVAAVDGEVRLVAGGRRLAACRELGLAEVPVRFAESMEEARDLLLAERDENTQRLEMKLSERAALGMAIEAIEKPKARERMLAGGPSGPGTRGSDYRPREVAAQAVGLSEPTYRRIKQAVTTAADRDEPAEVRAAATEAVQAIDAGAPVRPTIAKIKTVREEVKQRDWSGYGKTDDFWDEVQRLAADGLSSDQINERLNAYSTPNTLRRYAKDRGITFQADRVVIGKRKVNTSEALDNSVMSIEVAAGVIDVIDLDEVTPTQAAELLQRLTAAQTGINRLKKHLKEIAS